MCSRPWLALLLLIGVLFQAYDVLAKDYYELLQVIGQECTTSRWRMHDRDYTRRCPVELVTHSSNEHTASLRSNTTL